MKTEWVDCVPGMKEPIEARNIVVFLDDKDVTRDCFYARLPVTPNVTVKSEVGLFTNKDEVLRNGRGGEGIKRKNIWGKVWWKYREDKTSSERKAA